MYGPVLVRGREARFLYFVLAAEKVKIGKTYDIGKRLAELRNGCPVEVELLVSIETEEADQLERALHVELDIFRSHGEWFHDTRTVRAAMQREVLKRAQVGAA